jgi:hypothetical protein
MSTNALNKLSHQKNVFSVGISFDELITAINQLEKKDKESFIEDLLAATSPEYLESIREARSDYKEGRIYNHEETFIDIK